MLTLRLRTVSLGFILPSRLSTAGTSGAFPRRPRRPLHAPRELESESCSCGRARPLYPPVPHFFGGHQHHHCRVLGPPLQNECTIATCCSVVAHFLPALDISLDDFDLFIVCHNFLTWPAQFRPSQRHSRVERGVGQHDSWRAGQNYSA